MSLGDPVHKTPCLKAEGDDQNPRLPCDLHTCTTALMPAFTQTCTYTYRKGKPLSAIVRLKDKR